VTFEQWVAKVRDTKESGGASPATLTRFDHTTRVLCAVLINGRSFGKLTLAQIGARVARDALHLLQNSGFKGTVLKARVVIGECFRLATLNDVPVADPTHALKGKLSGIASYEKKGFPAATDEKPFAAVLKAIDRHPSLVLRSALQALALCYPRPGELRKARWRDVDFDTAIWIIPAANAKERRDYLIPLSRQAIAILTALPGERARDAPVFPAPSGRPLSKISLQNALIAVGVEKGKHSCHGFRASASTLLGASKKFDRDIIETSLAHLVGTATRRAYDRYDYWSERTDMAQWWADNLDELRRGD
jgi:integrase